jgi:outer membrane receptor protein involved in Fe transport
MRQLFRQPGLFLAFLLLCAVMSGPVRAQVGSLEVQVLDARDGGPLPGANVTLSNDQGFFATATLQTGPDGRVRFAVLRAVSGYSVEVGMPGFATHRLADLRVRSNVTERVDVMLTQELQERVQVTAHRDVVQLDEQGSTSKFDDTFIENLPVPGRFYQNMLSLAPGVNDWDDDGNPNVHGARTREFRATVGGVSNTDPLTGEWLSYINPESIEEMEILTAGAGVEYGRASGGFARIVQRQGSNEFEGLFTFIYRSSDLDGNGATGVGGIEVPDYEWVQPGIQLSGPIVKDKLWYRLSHEYLKREDPINFLDRIEVVSQTQRITADQLTWQVTPRNKLAFQYQKDPIEIENYGMDSRVEAEATQTLERGGPTYSVTWTAPYSSNLLVDTVLAYQNHKVDLTPTTQGVENDCVDFLLFPILDLARCFYADRATVTGSHSETVSDRRQRLTVSSQATLFNGRLLGMPHRFKFGLEIENERYYRKLDRGPDIFNFYTVYNPFGLDYGYATARVAAPRETSGRATGVSWALYAEDQFRPASNLTLTLGLRVDREEIDSVGRMAFDPEVETAEFYSRLDEGLPVFSAVPSVFTAYEDVGGFRDQLALVLGVGTNDLPLGSTAQQSAFWQNSRKPDDITLRNTNYSPRLSVAWDPWGDGKTKIAATAGRYYDKIFLAVPLLEVEPPYAEVTFLVNQFCAGCPWKALKPLEGIDATVSTQVVDRDLSTPYQDELSFSFERMLWPETSVKLTYIKRDYQDQLQDIDVNHRYGDEGRCKIAPTLGQPTVVASNGANDTIIDPYTFEEYVDTDPGPGDGRIDDCMGEIIRIGGTLGYDREVPDGKPDLYVMNPGWGEILLLGNFNKTEYEAFVLELVRRQYRNWQMNASYTWSEAVGQAEDFTQLQGNERNLREDEWGPLAYDQTHAVKVSAVSLTPWGFRFGGTLRWESGLPYSLLRARLTAFNVPLDYGGLGDKAVESRLRYPTGQRNDQRNPPFWTLDLRAAREIRLSRRAEMQLTAEVFNLFDDDTLRLESLVDGVTTGERRFGRRWQLGMRLSF